MGILGMMKRKRNALMSANDIAINRQQQMQLHNARCFFEQFKKKYTGILGVEVLRDFDNALKYLTDAHKPIRAVESERSENRHAHYEAMREHYNLTAVWSMYEYPRLDDNVDAEFADITSILYHLNEVPVIKRPEHPWLRWTDVYEACDKAIQLSNDTHHIYIEYLYQDDNDPKGLYRLQTGS